jgi:spore maturation protein SpmB
MKELQEINPNKDTASNAQLMFLVLNASGLTVIPISVIADRVTLGSTNPTSIFIPTLLATFCSTLGGLTYMCIRQRIKLLDPVLLAYIFGFMAAVGGAVAYFATLSKEELQRQSTLFASVIILTIIISFITLGLVRRINVFDAFIEGAKEGFNTAIKVIPYLVAILVAVAIFRTSGTLDAITGGLKWALLATGINADFVDALPVAFLKPLSGQGARAMMLDISAVKNFGPDSFVGNLTAIFRGCAETTLYLVALYFGSISVRNTRYAVTGGLIADACGAIAAIFIAYVFFH